MYERLNQKCNPSYYYLCLCVHMCVCVRTSICLPVFQCAGLYHESYIRHVL